MPLVPGPVAGDAMILMGDAGRDVVSIDLTTFGGRLDMSLFAGNNNVTIQNNTFRKGKLQAMHSDDHACAPYDKSNKVEGVPFCNKE